MQRAFPRAWPLVAPEKKSPFFVLLASKSLPLKLTSCSQIALFSQFLEVLTLGLGCKLLSLFSRIHKILLKVEFSGHLGGSVG